MLLSDLQAIVGEGGWSTDEELLAPHLAERRGRVHGSTLVMLSPRSTAQVAAIVSACAHAGAAIVPQGGNTGLCGGAIPDLSGQQVLLSLARLNRIRDINVDDFSITVEAGCILADVQAAARDAGLWFPLSLGAEGSCQIGGNLATNAGGTNVLRYGTARQQVLGIEVVLADGTTWNGLRSLRKDTGGYDMKQVFLGSEGTLGIITAATLRLLPKYPQTQTALVALPSARAAMQLLGRLRAATADQVQAFELLSDTAMNFALRHGAGLKSPLAASHPWTALIEAATSQADTSFEATLMAALEDGLVLDAVLAKNNSEAQQLWRIRHAIPAAQAAEGASLKHDIAVPIGRIDEFLGRAEELLRDLLPRARVVAFGHVGDGNLHYNVTQPVGDDAERFLRDGEQASAAIYELVHELEGSFSAEHGVGTLKKAYLQRFRSSTEIKLMRALKQALDPANTLNPGKVI